MRDRLLTHVAGPVGAGKSTFIARLLDAEVAFAICVRAERDPMLRKEQESAPKTHAELRRYREAGASAVALYRFAEPSMDAFFTTAFMQDYSEAVLIEGDCPLDYVDLSVLVAPVPSKGRSLLRRVVRDHTASHEASVEQLSWRASTGGPATSSSRSSASRRTVSPRASSSSATSNAQTRMTTRPTGPRSGRLPVPRVHVE